MASINKVIIIGHLGRDPEDRNGVVNISVATTESWKDKQTGEKKDVTEWHRVTFFGKLAEIAAQYLTKGSQVYVEGRLRTNKYTDKDGIERYQTGIIADRMQMLGGRQDGANSGQNRQNNGPSDYERAKQTGRRAAPPAYDDDSDVPF